MLNEELVPEQQLEKARCELIAIRQAMVGNLLSILKAQIALFPETLGYSAFLEKPGIDQEQANKNRSWLENLDNVHASFEFKEESSAELEHLKSHPSEAMEVFYKANSELIGLKEKVVELSKIIGSTKAEQGLASYIDPKQEERVFSNVFGELAKYSKDELSPEFKESITKWYRHSIAGSLHAQKPFNIFVYKDDEHAKQAAEKYLPEYNVVEIEVVVHGSAERLSNGFNDGDENLLIVSDEFIQKPRFQYDKFPDSAQMFTLFPEYSAIEGFGDIKGIAKIKLEKLIEADKALPFNAVRREEQQVAAVLS